MTYQKIPDDQYQKALFHLRSQLSAVWNFANCYGLNRDVEIALKETELLTIQFSQVVRGKDKPIKVIERPKRRPTE